MALPKLDFKKILDEIDAKWTSFMIGLLSLTYFVGKIFLQFISSIYVWIIIAVATALIFSPEFNAYVKNKIKKLMNKFRKPAEGDGNASNRSSEGPNLGNLFQEH